MKENIQGCFHGEELSTARYVRCDVGNAQAVHNREQGDVGRKRQGYAAISERRVLDSEDRCAMERPAAGIWQVEYRPETFLPLEGQGNLGKDAGSGDTGA